MKIQIPDKVRVFMAVSERVGIPTILCLVFGYLYFIKLEKVMNDLNTIQIEMKLNGERAKSDFDELKREVRRLGYRRER